MNINIIKEKNTTILNISGSVDATQIKEFTGIIEEICSSADRDIEMNLEKVEYMDSTGISLLLKIHKCCKQSGNSFSISGVSEKIESLLSLCSLNETLLK